MSTARLYYITKTLLSYGLDELVPKHKTPWFAKIMRGSFFWLRNQHKEKSVGLRLRLALQELGPVWIKFGQMLSTRRDLLPHDIALELAFLQDQVQPFEGELAQEIIEKALEINDISELFSEFSQAPLASASIAQVHTAKLIDEHNIEQDVVIKVIRPNIHEQINADLALMEKLAKVLAKVHNESKRLRPVEVVKEYKKTLLDELDLMREGANGIQLKRNFEDSDSLYIPAVYSDYSRHNILVMERIYGIPVSDTDALLAQNTNMKLLAERGVEVFFTQVFRDSFFHADMHPGNIFVSREHPENPKYIGIDCGIVGTLNKEDKRYLAENFIAFFNRDYRQVAQLHVDSGWVPPDTSIEEFEFAIRTVCEPIFNKPLAEISFGHVLVNLFNTARRFNMQVQPQLVLLQKTLLYVEGLGRQLYPQLDLWKTAKPFLEDWVKQQVGPLSVLKQMYANLPFWAEKMPELPDLIYQNLKRTPRTQVQIQKVSQKPLILGLFGSATIIMSALCYLQHDLIAASIAISCSAVSFITAWRSA
ncbi:ubiquinone biosynthesis regulatory protein kinase UbiB [Pseudoalteromonas fuliginea]|uniref:ubiquinone biosynthesis regulatory protein kinase UbiB n=1 Tax=Pseudoalteromonas TaxID=53246 RepID=UPI0002AA6B9E|nr:MULTISPECIES: ubiquinone biosynthesis regulatory protein kinase UbiB [unclassified Pseudoalteromonas]ALQ09602.1 ubiquinone biosynthesis protein UbiB [Pseudoalteromonas sp. Bsw20308]MDQ2045131.1 ubiquinone biosynthesis regulatory protein kinase UbiB [Pseudoalteromonas sp. 20-92]